MQTQQLSVERIIVARNAPPLDEATVNALVESMGRVGLINPVTVWRPTGVMPELIAGHHRLEAARRLQWEQIDAYVIEGNDHDQQAAVGAEIRGIDENLIRRTLSDAERASMIARRKELYEIQHPETKKGAIGNGREKVRQIGDSTSARFTKEVAKATGKSERAIQRDATRAKAIPRLPELVGTSLDKGVELDALARLDPEKQEEMINNATAGKIVSARQRLTSPPSHHPQDDTERSIKWRRSFETVWNKAPSAADREWAMEWIDRPIMDGSP
jgi:hypothetical protein